MLARSALHSWPPTQAGLWVHARVGSSDWHGLILGGRALDCASRMGLGFRPGPEHHILDTLSIRIPRCEDYTRVRKDRAYAFEVSDWLVEPAARTEAGPY